MRYKMIITKRKPVSVGEMINEEFIAPLGITQGQLSSAMGVSRRNDIWAALHSPKRMKKMERVSPIREAIARVAKFEYR